MEEYCPLFARALHRGPLVVGGMLDPSVVEDKMLVLLVDAAPSGEVEDSWCLPSVTEGPPPSQLRGL